MKKGLLFILALGLGSWVYGQNLAQKDYKVNSQPKEAQIHYDAQSMDVAGPVSSHQGVKGTISAVTIGYSNNVYTMLVEQQSCLTANQDLGVIQFFHRAKIGDHGARSSGDMMTSRSVDGGLTWNTFMAMSNSSGHNLRYPSGQIYNPTANTDVNLAYSVYCGPVSDGAGWVETFAGSIMLDSTNVSNNLFPSYGALIRMGEQVTTDGKVHCMGSAYHSSPVYGLDTNYLLTGNFNSTNNNFDWSLTKFNPTFVADSSDGSEFAYVWYFNTAWSADGTIGYFWTVGRDASNDTRSYQPIVWKSTDSGANWTKMPVFDFSTLSVITDLLQPMKGVSPATSRPQFSSALDGTVDANGDLHLMALIKACSSNNGDSLGYSYYIANTSNMSNPIFDVYTTASGWDARQLGQVYTVAVPAAESGFNGIGWDLRLQAGRTVDGTKVFASWTDTDTTIAPIGTAGLMLDMLPDIYVAGWDIVSGKQAPATNFTIGTSIYGDCFFQYMSDIILANNGTYTVPMTEIDKDVDPINPITHNYITGITFDESDFVDNIGFQSTVDNLASVSQNRPNPFNGSTQIDVNLKKSSNLSITVISIAGQKVFEENYGTQSAGNHTITISADKLASGIYFYTVNAGNSTITKKMIVE